MEGNNYRVVFMRWRLQCGQSARADWCTSVRFSHKTSNRCKSVPNEKWLIVKTKDRLNGALCSHHASFHGDVSVPAEQSDVPQLGWKYLNSYSMCCFYKSSWTLFCGQHDSQMVLSSQSKDPRARSPVGVNGCSLYFSPTMDCRLVHGADGECIYFNDTSLLL